MVLGPASPALSAVRHYNRLIFRMFLQQYPNAPTSALARPISIMRRLLVAFGLIGGSLSLAFAADYDLPILRGSQPVAPIAPVLTVGPATFTRWSGFYVGGDFSYNYSRADFSGASTPLVAFSLRDLAVDQAMPSQWQVLGQGSSNAFGGGGFLGYNMQWQDLITSVEATYTHTNLNTTAPSSSINRVVADGIGNTDHLVISANGHLDLTDYASVRGRAGYIVGNLLPYGFVGFVVGRADYGVTTHVIGQQNSASPAFFPCDPTLPTCIDLNLSNNAGQSNALLYGYSAGAGLDWALTPNVFVRGEFEFVQFAPISNISVIIVNARAGAGFKF
jgi:outer membrane immunogenic protein